MEERHCGEGGEALWGRRAFLGAGAEQDGNKEDMTKVHYVHV